MEPAKSLDKFLPYQLSVTSNAVSGRIAQEYRTRFGLSVPEWRVMAVLGDAGILTQRDLTQRTVMDKVAVNRACKVLEERELIARTPNEQDGRSHLLALTKAGENVYSQVMPLAVEMEKLLFSALTAAEMKQFRALLEKVRGQVDGFTIDSVNSDNFGIS